MASFQNNCQVYQAIKISQLNKVLNLWDPTWAVPTDFITHTHTCNCSDTTYIVETSSWTKPVRNSKLISIHISSSLASSEQDLSFLERKQELISWNQFSVPVLSLQDSLNALTKLYDKIFKYSPINSEALCCLFQSNMYIHSWFKSLI